jgi:hypothetical protein
MISVEAVWSEARKALPANLTQLNFIKFEDGQFRRICTLARVQNKLYRTGKPKFLHIDLPLSIPFRDFRDVDDWETI